MEALGQRCETEEFLAKFSISFSWDYPDDWSLGDVIAAVFHVVDDRDERCQDQLVCSGVQSSGCGMMLSQPHTDTDVIPCELTFMAHPISSEFCITKIFVVSEAKNLELYIDNMYEKTTRGLMLTLKKGKNAALFENEFDLASHIQGSNKVTLKFVSMPEKHQMRLQTVVVKVAKCSSNQQASSPASLAMGMSSKSFEMDGVRQMIQSLGMNVPPGGENLMKQIESQQKQLQALQLQQLLSNGLLQGGLPSNLLQTSMQTSSAAQSKNRQQHKDQINGQVPLYEESILTNAILNTEKYKQETHKANEERQKKAQYDAQVNYFKQLLNRQESLSNKPSLSASVHADVINDEVNQERNLSQIMARLLNENQGQSSASAEFLTDCRNDQLLRSKTRTSQRFNSKSRPNSVFTPQTSRPASFSFSDTSDRDFQRQISESEDGPKHLPTHLPANSKRCQECGCPGCLSVYNSVTTNIYAMEERLLGRIDLKMQELSRHLDNKFDALHDALFAHQEQLAMQLADNLPRSPVSRKTGKDTVMYRSDEQ